MRAVTIPAIITGYKKIPVIIYNRGKEISRKNNRP
jgi:hypothetical protein